jgi:hypothetical protein
MMISMNNTREMNIYGMTQTSSATSVPEEFIAGLLGATGFMIIISIIIFIIWIWSMISMISLNIRFKDFYAVYMSEKAEKNTLTDNNESITHGERVIELLQESDRQPKVSWVNKKLSTTSVIIFVSLAVLAIALIAAGFTQS